MRKYYFIASGILFKGWVFERTSKHSQGNVHNFFRYLLNVDKAMVAHQEPKILKDLVMPSKLKGFDDSKFQASTYVAKQKLIKVDLVTKDRVDDIVAKDNISKKY